MSDRIEGIGARAYHDATKHSWQSVRSGDHFLDWETKPFPFKVYPDAPALALPREIPAPEMPALEALAGGRGQPGRRGLDLGTLGQILFFCAGVTKKKVYPGGEEVHFRAAASTGALYEVEVYVVAGDVAGLDPGVHHFCPGDFTLRRLRAGDWRAALSDAAGEAATVAGAPVTIVLSAIYWRNTWKYTARGYRHFFWDSGTLLANLLGTATAAGVPARVLTGFADAPVNRLLGLDSRREAALVLVPLGAGAAPPAAAPPVEPLALATVPLSAREIDYPLVRQAYLGSSLESGDRARAWIEADPGAPVAAPPAQDSQPLPPAAGSPASLGSVILRRGSTRQFAREPIGAAELAAILDAAGRPAPLDVNADRLIDTYLLVHAVDGVPPGAYVNAPGAGGLRRLRGGELREEGGHLCLDQPLGADASVVAFFLADLGAALRRFGDRGYRVANLVAGLYGGRMYLAAYALGLGASGLTFYDDDVVRTFSPHAEGKDAIFVTALGRASRGGGSRGLPRAEGRLTMLRPGDR